MRIGLLDIDNHSAKKKRGATIFPNIALAKISRYHKMQGDDVEWAQPIFGSYDIIYASKIFNFSPDFNRLEYHADKFILGGTGYDLTSELPEEIDRLQPDYSIYPNVPDDVAYGFLTRGCPNHCKWCVVPKKDGKSGCYIITTTDSEGYHRQLSVREEDMVKLKQLIEHEQDTQGL
jgi:hypothetical protein